MATKIGSDIPVEKLKPEQAWAEYLPLGKELERLNWEYHEKDSPSATDAQFDSLKKRFQDIEAHFPYLKRPDSPIQKVGE